jgi:hypothetical protein
MGRSEDFHSHLWQPLPTRHPANYDDPLSDRIGPGTATIQYRYGELEPPYLSCGGVLNYNVQRF